MIWLGLVAIIVVIVMMIIDVKICYSEYAKDLLMSMYAIICALICTICLLLCCFIPPIPTESSTSTQSIEITEFKKVISDNNEESYVYTTNKTEVHSARVEDKRDKRKDGAITSIDLANSNPSKLIVKEYECLRLVDFSMIKNHEYIFI